MNKIIHKRLLAEAEYFGVEAMLDKLQGSASTAPNSSGKSILYWLGITEEQFQALYGSDDYGCVSFGPDSRILFSRHAFTELALRCSSQPVGRDLDDF